MVGRPCGQLSSTSKKSVSTTDAQKSFESRDQWDLVYCLTCDSSCIMWILSGGVMLLESLASGLSFCCFGCLEHRWAQAAINGESHRCDSLTLVSLNILLIQQCTRPLGENVARAFHAATRYLAQQNNYRSGSLFILRSKLQRQRIPSKLN